MALCRASRTLLVQRMDQAFENETPIFATEKRFAGALGVRHEAGDVAAFVANSGDVQH